MEPYYKKLSSSMCDFEPFYKMVAAGLPDNCRLAEVGVADGYSSLMMAHTLKEMGKLFHLTMIDNCDYGKGDQANEIMSNIIKSGLGDYITFRQMGSLDASCKYPDGYFDFVFIDASHKYEETKADIRLWYRKVKDEGLLAGHDYTCPENPEVAQAVNEVIPETLLKTNVTSMHRGVWMVIKNPKIFY